jgi:hypothetical protein
MGMDLHLVMVENLTKEDGTFPYRTLPTTELGQKVILMVMLVVQVDLLQARIKHLCLDRVVVEYFQALGQTLLIMALVLLLLTVAQEEKLVVMATPLVVMEVLLAVVVAGVQQVVEDTEVLLQVYNVKAATQEQL